LEVKRMDKSDDAFVCPRCGADATIGTAHCSACGEALDWSDFEEAKDPAPMSRTEDTYICPACGTDLLKGLARCPNCGGELDWNDIVEVEPTMEEQRSVNSLLGRGVLFSIVWLGGIGSIYSLILARRAKRMIELSEGHLKGMGRVCWCYILGWAGVGIWGLIFLLMIVRSLR